MFKTDFFFFNLCMESVLLVLFFSLLLFNKGRKKKWEKKKKKLFYSCSVQFYSVVIVVDCSVNPVKKQKKANIFQLRLIAALTTQLFNFFSCKRVYNDSSIQKYSCVDLKRIKVSSKSLAC